MKKFQLLALISVILIVSCQITKRSSDSKTDKDYGGNISTAQSVVIPKDDKTSPVTGEMPVSNPDTVLTINEIGRQYEVKFGQEVNFIYEDGIDPDATYFSYESTYDGYILTLRERNEPIDVEFERMCQIFIVANPNLTYVEVPDELRYEQIIWTPRKDGTWEVRIGTTERGCKSKALNELRILRNHDYEKSIPR